MAVTPQPIGILLPIQDGPAGYFQQSFDVISQIKCNLISLFNTKKGERRMNLNFGSDLWNQLFEFNDDNLSQIVESSVRRDVATWMPYVNIQSVSVNNDANQIDENAVSISVSFTVPSAGVTSIQNVALAMNQGHS
jgi:phage baseplate assembly protein W